VIGDRWIWPASLAASLVLCTTLVMQMARGVNSPPEDRVSQRSINLTPPAAPASTQSGNTAVGSWDANADPALVIQLPGQSLDPESTEFWWEQLRYNAHNADRDGFLATWEVYQDRRDSTPLPDDLKRWMADNRVPLPPPSGG